MDEISIFKPDLIYVAGWNNKKYLKIARAYKNKGISVVTGMDNHWKGNLKQRVAGILSPWLIRPYFTDIWIPGSPQFPFAQNLGFGNQHIKNGLYCADENQFHLNTPKSFTKSIVFVGRLVDHKGLLELFSVLEELSESNFYGMKFHFIGNGPLADRIPAHPSIKHTTFVDPVRLPELLQAEGFLILPSTYEAWGVVVHEALLSGLPVISTYQCGAAIDFIRNGENGFLFDADDKEQLKGIIEEVAEMSEETYRAFSSRAIDSAGKVSLDQWSDTINGLARQ
ncbi:glycosyltransferase [Algoriphagus formosus]|uniref:glycosyltransferase n=1 Tax=Algoriphagus formosus TaxID=2007308 RepID=UPI0018E2349D|nr:glycosyltransferase [Algoriphagus formosus]